MKQRTLRNSASAAGECGGIHLALILDGNGRWATARGLPRLAGHRAGARAVSRVVEAAAGMGISHLTLYAFSSDNWERPPREVAGLMRLFRAYLAAETARCVENDVWLRVIGRRDRFSPALLRAIEAAETATAGGRRLQLRIALDYSARDALVRAAGRLAGGEAAGEPTREAFAAAMAEALGTAEPVPDVDLLVRTGGEQRLSDFLLWECAYAELLFLPEMWPDFGAAELESAVAYFHTRQRRFGRLPEAAAG